MNIVEPGLRPKKEARKAGQSVSRLRTRTRLLHRIFEIGIFAKGLDGAVELVGGLVLLFLSRAAIRGTILLLVEGELKEDPTDLIANLILDNTATVIHGRASTSAFLILHGVVKLGLVAGLATNRLWSYPTALVVFTGLTIYQVYGLFMQYSLLLAAITVLDVMVIALIAMEYRQVRPTRTRGS